MIIAVINQKGGVGKTALAYNMAIAFARMEINTRLIDLDPSANATKGLKFNEATIPGKFIDYIFEDKFPDITNCTYTVPTSLLGEKVTSDDTLGYSYLSLCPASIQLAIAQMNLSNRIYRETILARALQDAMGYSINIIDCAPTLSHLTVNAIYAADFILIPMTYENDALEGLSDLFRVVKEVKGGHDYTFKLVRNKFDARKTVTNSYIDSALKDFEASGMVLKTIIRTDESINQAKIESKSIFQFAPKSNGSYDIQKLVEEIKNDYIKW